MATAYVDDTATLESWRAEISAINVEAVDVLNRIKAHLGELPDGLKGDSADYFSAAFESGISNAIVYHESMKNLESFMDTYALVLESE